MPRFALSDPRFVDRSCCPRAQPGCPPRSRRRARSISHVQDQERSGWTWNTSAGGSAGFGFISRRIGDVCLERSGRPGRGVQLQDRGRRRQHRIQGEPEQLDARHLSATGQLYLTDTFAGAELTSSDIDGFCLVQEVAIGGRDRGVRHRACCSASRRRACRRRPSRTPGALGIAAQLAVDHPKVNLSEPSRDRRGPSSLTRSASPWTSCFGPTPRHCSSCGGFNAGPQLQAGLSGSFGYVKFAKVQPVKPPPPPPPPPSLRPPPGHARHNFSDRRPV